MSEVVIYTDGAAFGNPGPGGYAAILISGNAQKEITGGFAHTTNNRMELLAVIMGLEALKRDGCTVSIYTDSTYVANAVEQNWLFDWERKNFNKKKNPDLWRRFLLSYRKHKVKMIWVKGHAGNLMNERCDRLAVAAAKASNLPADEQYLASIQQNSLFE
ncbi:MAG: ribonuclease HI [Bacteroidales bacterium]|nr:ribonuclease HI [Bacteroidales bacterium]MCL2133298.1 ribonuclease HI [Bacteroidales bacterium]